MINHENLDEKIKLLKSLTKKINEKIPGIDEKFEEQYNLRMSLIKESDRGAVLLSVAFLESYLENALKSKLIGSKNRIDKLFDLNGALGSFSNKIDMSFSIGIINEKIYNDLTNIRKIRNKFAHTYELIELSSPTINDNILKLKLCPRKNIENSSARQIFISTIFYLISIFLSISLKRQKLPIDIIIDSIDQNIEECRNLNIFT